MEFYYDYTKEAYNYIMASNILRNRDKKILRALVEGKKTKEIAYDNKCSYRTICSRRKEIFEKTKCLMDYTLEDGDIEEYYLKHQKRNLKVTNSDNLKVVKEETYLFKVYLLTFPNSKVYVGITSREENKRWKEGIGYADNESMYNDILKYGWLNIKKNILYKDLTFEEARDKEKELIINYKSHLKKYGYNKNF